MPILRFVEPLTLAVWPFHSFLFWEIPNDCRCVFK